MSDSILPPTPAPQSAPVAPPSPHERALAAAGLINAQPVTTSGAAVIPATPPPFTHTDAVALVDTLNMIAVMGVRAYATSRGLRWSDDLNKMAQLAPSERAQLIQLAPAAGPVIQKWLTHLDKVAALIFAGAFVGMVSERVGRIKQLVPQKVAEQKKADAAKPSVKKPRKGMGVKIDRVELK